MKYNGKSFSYSNNTNIDLLNVDHLYDYLYEIDHDPNRSLGQNILNLLNHVSVTLYLSDISFARVVLPTLSIPSIIAIIDDSF